MARDLTDAQWCVLDLLLRAKRAGVAFVHRREILFASNLPQMAAMRLTWALLTMPGDLVLVRGEHEFQISPQGEATFEARFGRPTCIAEAVICLPDLSAPARVN